MTADPITASSPCPSCGNRAVERARDNPAHTVNTGARVFVSRIVNVLCRECGLIFNDPMPAEDQLGELYRAMARDVRDRPNLAAARIMPIEEEQAAFASRHLEVRTGAPAVLDIGCSMGGFLAAMSARGARTVGVEPSPHDAAVARERFGIDVRQDFFEHVDFAGERFDLISLRFVFEHVREPRAVIGRAKSLLAPRGLLFIDVPNLAMPFVGFDDFFSYGHLQTFVPETLAGLCARDGWTPVAIEENANLFASSPHPPSIRAVFRAGAPASDAGGQASAERVRAHLGRYTAAREAFVQAARQRVDRALAGARRAVIYGAGTHTAEMWQACPGLAAHVVAMVDGNPRLQGHRFLGVPVHSPRELPALGADVVVISVRTAEAQIAEMLEHERLADRVVRFYERAGLAAA